MEIYTYTDVRYKVFLEENQRPFLAIRDYVNGLLDKAGAFQMGAILEYVQAVDNWVVLAFVDRLVELGEIREIQQSGVGAQYRIFTR